MTPIEDVVAAAAGPVWFQLYVYKDRSASEALVRRVEAAGCTALVSFLDRVRPFDPARGHLRCRAPFEEACNLDRL